LQQLFQQRLPHLNLLLQLLDAMALGRMRSDRSFIPSQLVQQRLPRLNLLL
jgi:hypothetical protein